MRRYDDGDEEELEPEAIVRHRRPVARGLDPNAFPGFSVAKGKARGRVLVRLGVGAGGGGAGGDGDDGEPEEAGTKSKKKKASKAKGGGGRVYESLAELPPPPGGYSGFPWQDKGRRAGAAAAAAEEDEASVVASVARPQKREPVFRTDSEDEGE